MSSSFKKMRNYTMLALAGAVLAGCITAADHTTRQAHGELAGKVVVFTGAEGEGETAGIFVNDKFVAALPAKHQLDHNLCQGVYKLKARSVQPTAGKDNKIIHISGERAVRVEKGQVQYFNLQRKAKGWEFVAVDQAAAELKMSDDKLVRRMTDEMLECK